MPSQIRNRQLARHTVISYGLPGLVTAIPIIPIAILLPSFYALDLGLGFTLTGLALGAARLLDFFSDVLVGIAVDRVRWRASGGQAYQYKPWLFVGALVAALGLFQLAAPVSIEQNLGGAGYLALWSSVLFLGWTLMMVPYTAWGAVLSDNPHDRSRLTIARESAGLIGMLLALSAPALMTQLEMSSMALVFWLTLCLGAPILTYSLITVPEFFTGKSQTDATRIKLADVAQLLKFRPFRFTVVCWFLNSLANGLPAVLFPVIAQQYFLFDDQGVATLLLLYFGAGVLVAPLWLKLAKRWGKIRAWRTAITINILVFSTVVFINPNANGFSLPISSIGSAL